MASYLFFLCFLSSTSLFSSDILEDVFAKKRSSFDISQEKGDYENAVSDQDFSIDSSIVSILNSLSEHKNFNTSLINEYNQDTIQEKTSLWSTFFCCKRKPKPLPIFAPPKQSEYLFEKKSHLKKRLMLPGSKL